MFKKYRIINTEIICSNEKSRKWLAFESLSVIFPVFLAMLGIVTTLLLLIGKLQSLYIVIFTLPLALASSFIVFKYFPRKMPGSIKERRIFGVIVLLFILSWSIFNSLYSSENVYINKDPGIYSSSAQWLTYNDNLKIESSNSFGDSSNVLPTSSGIETFNGDRSRLYVQAPHYFPMLLSIGGRIMGSEQIYMMNAFIGGMALFALYGASKFILRPKWAFLLVLVMSLSLPMIYFSRDTYTEPLTMALVFGAIGMIAIAEKAVKKPIVWITAGMVSASGVLVRVDFYIVLAALLLSVFAIQLISNNSLRVSLKNICFFVLGSFICGAVAYLDLTLLSKKYYSDLRMEIISQLVIVVIVLILGILSVVAYKNKTKIFKIKNIKVKKLKKYLLIGVIAVMTLGFLFVISRPLWLTSYDQKVAFNKVYINSLQQKEGLPLEGTRSYAELSHLWIVWYFGAVVFVLGYFGVTLELIKAINKPKKNVLVIVFIAVFATTSMLYVNRPTITPDQIWATRRFLPIIFPMFCLFALSFMQSAYESARYARYKKIKNVMFATLVVLLVLSPLINSQKHIFNKEFSGFLAEIDTICKTIPQDSAVLIIGPSSSSMLFTIRARCNIEAERIVSPSKEELYIANKTAISSGLKTVIILKGHEYNYLPAGSKVTMVSSTDYIELERTITKPPSRVDYYKSVIFISSVNELGQVTEYKP